MRLTQITPFVPCTSLEKQVAFYRDVLGFAVGYLAEGVYAFMRRDEVAVRLVQVSETVDLSHPERENSFYIDVQGINAVWLEMQPRLAALPEGRVRAPFDQDYGQREFHVADEDCTLVFFGEAIPRH
jgi:catechol 2,3-dioxygenase-like lactoylglutathione lyase family enzyme